MLKQKEFFVGFFLLSKSENIFFHYFGLFKIKCRFKGINEIRHLKHLVQFLTQHKNLINFLFLNKLLFSFKSENYF